MNVDFVSLVRLLVCMIILFPTNVAATPKASDLLPSVSQEDNARPEVDFSGWEGLVLSDHRAAISREIQENKELLPFDGAFVLTAFEVSKDGSWGRAVIVPTYVFDAGWENVSAEDIVELLLYRSEANTWNAFLFGSPDFEKKVDQVPRTFIDFSSYDVEPLSVEEYRFPWTYGHTWWKNGGWHDGYWGLPNNAIDFQPQVSGDIAVLAAANGTLSTVCDRPDDSSQIWLKMTNADGTSGYGHIDKPSFDRSLLGTTVYRGTTIGNLYNPGGYFETPCGWGTNTHLHFVFPTTDVSMYDLASERYVPASEMGIDTGIGVVSYTSNNTLSGSCPTSGGVILYWNANYNCDNSLGDPGYRLRSTTGLQNVNDGSFNDQASSVRVPSGWSVKVSEHENGGGGTKCFNTDYADFSTAGTFDGTSTPVNDNVSSMEVFDNTTCSSGPEPTPVPTPIPSDWYVEFFSDTTLSSRCSPANLPYAGTYVFRDWGDGSADPSCPSDNWSARFWGDVYFQSGTYSFGLGSDDWARMIIDQDVVLNNWQGAGQHYATRSYSAGYRHVTIEFADTLGSAKLAAWWWGPGYDMPRESRDPYQWYAQYWGNRSLWWDSIVQVNEGTGTLDHAWGSGGPGYGLPVDLFSSRFERQAYFGCGTYRFSIPTDDGVRFWIDGGLKLDKWMDQAYTWTLDASLTEGYHELKLEHYENGGGAAIGLSWSKLAGCVPDAPTNLVATAVSQSQINLSWTDNANDEDGFKIERSHDAANWTQIDTVSANTYYYSDTGLASGTRYYYRVRAYNGIGNSDYSNVDDDTTFSLPEAPSGLMATAISQSQINVTWTDNSSNEDGFHIERSLNGIDWTQIDTVGIDATSYSDTGLNSGTTYYYRVQAYNFVGTSPYSDMDSDTTFTVLPASPFNLVATPVSSSQIDLSWADSADNEDGFRIERSLYETAGFAPIATLEADSTSYSDTGLSSGTTYYYRVYAFNAAGDSAYAADDATTLSPPYAPSNPTPADGTTGVSITTDLSWTGGDPDAGDTVTYDVYFGTTNPPTTLLCNDVSSPTCDPGTLAYDTDYYWYVVATDNQGDSATSSTWGFTTASAPNNPPYEPSNPMPADGATDVSITTDLSWTGGDPDAGDTVTYDVYFGTTNPPTTLLCNDVSSPTCDPGTLAYDTDYYWYVVATDNHGDFNGGSPWSFTTELEPNSPPYAPSNPTPADATAGVSITTDLSWTGGDPDAGDTVTYDVYFGATNPPTTLLCDDASSPACDPGTLAYDTDYYWYVVATDNHGDFTSSGSPWSFKTGSASTEYIDQVASGETAIAGTIDGTFLYTHENDGVAQSIQEEESGGKVTNRFSYLEHKWLVYVRPGDSVTLNANAWRSTSTDGDTFIFAYSTDDVHYVDMFTIIATSDDDSFRTYSLPPSTSGVIYVRVSDSDHTRGNRALDTVFVDHLYVRSVNPPPPTASIHVGDLDGSSAPGAKTRWNATVTVTIHDASEGPVLGAVVSGIWSGGETGTGACTTDASGTCSITLDSLRTNVSSVTFTVTSVVQGAAYYDSTANHDPDGDSNGTSITVYKTAAAIAGAVIERGLAPEYY